MSLYQETQRTLAFVFTGIVVLLLTAAIAIGADAWPGICVTRSLTGSSCPDCGLVRGVLYVCAGDLAAAARSHAAAPFVAAWLAVQPPARFLLARWRARGTTGLALGLVDLGLCIGAFEVMR
ncbi:MAG: DUF2752 domain-containing protein [Planctomycetes bacterium]|nr:DUF2752 domain-containing protein [Planctomycetota bacterium]MCC7172252.1 DUF2752 domain-containing protein [Planctomycetota bacterium]